MNKVWKIIIPNYEDKVPISQRRRAKYYKKEDYDKGKLPKKYQVQLQRGLMTFDSKGFIIDLSKNRVIANPLSAGKPKYWTINGQRIYDGSLHYTARSKVARWAHKYLGEYVKQLPKINIPKGRHLRIWLDIYKPGDKLNWDCDNQWIWTKWFLDTLVELEKIPDDNVEYVRSSGQINYIESDERKLVFNIQII